VENPQKLIFRGGLVKVGSFFVHKKRVRRPYEVNVLSTHHKFLQPFAPLELEPRIAPELAKVHVKREILKKKKKEKNEQAVAGCFFLKVLTTSNTTLCR
jgi:hypothetical protein